MDTGLLHLHSLLRYIIFFGLIAAIVFSFMKNNKIKLVGLILLIASHITLIIGLYQWFTGSWGLKNIQNMGMSGVMKDKVARFFAVEHLIGMILAILLITIAYRSAKTFQFKKAQWLYILAFILILALVPWPFKELGRTWLPY